MTQDLKAQLAELEKNTARSQARITARIADYGDHGFVQAAAQALPTLRAFDTRCDKLEAEVERLRKDIRYAESVIAALNTEATHG